jgi:formate dehydrogenase subunit gamma
VRLQADAPSEAEISEIVAAHLGREGPMLPILHALQAAFGHVPQAAVPRIAEALNLTRAEVHGVLSFYHDFRGAPAGRHHVRLCRAEACKSVGAAVVAEELLARLGVGWGETTADGGVTVDAVYCLGLCACGPSAMVDGRVHGRVDAERLAALVEASG